MLDKTEEYRKKLTADFPDLTISSVKIIGSGWHHDAVEINSEIIFRLPRGVHETESTVEIELALLKELTGKLPVEIPEPLHVAPDNEYFGYPKVGGVLLDELTKDFNEADWHQLKLDWVALAAAIHAAIPAEQAHALQVPNLLQPGPNPAEDIFKLKSVEPEILEFAHRTLEQLKQLDPASLHDTFLHNDLQFHNILADPATKRIAGLIDWTDACLGPRSREFAVSEWWAKPGLLEEVIKLYQGQTGILVDIEQVKLWRHLEELSDYAENTLLGDTDKAQKTLLRLKELINA